MTELKLTKDERLAIIHWLNGAGGDNDYFITRPTGNTHVQRQTINIKGGKWKVRVAYEADTGFPLAMGAPIQQGASGRHEEKPGLATVPAQVTQDKVAQQEAVMMNYMIQSKAPKPKLYTPKELGLDLFEQAVKAEIKAALNQPNPLWLAIDDPSPLFVPPSVTIDTPHGKLTLHEGSEFAPGFVEAYNLEHELVAQTNYVLVPMHNKLAYVVTKQGDAW